LGAFFDHYFDRIFATVRRLVGGREVAEDLTQEVFLKIQRGIGRLDLSRDPAPWLYTVAVNACRDYWRSGPWRMMRRSVSLEDPAIAVVLTSQGGDPELAMLQAEDERRLYQAIERLPGPLRMTVILHDCEGLDHQEIAEITGVRYAATRKRYSRALLALGALLREGSSS
jgi:RNA polymerase sigma-70 factor (ECF subfamily)